MNRSGWDVVGTAAFRPTGRAEIAVNPGPAMSLVVGSTTISRRSPGSSTGSVGIFNSPPRVGQAQVPVAQDVDEAIWVRDVERDGVQLTAPWLRVRVTDEDRDGIYLVEDGYSTVYGCGESPEVAIDEYVSNLFEHFGWLEDHKANLAPLLQEELQRLRRYFVRLT